MHHHFQVLIILIVTLLISSCGGGSRNIKNVESFKQVEEDEKAELNQKISSQAALYSHNKEDDLVYLLGAGDVIEVTVFNVEELNTTVRVNGRGQIILPLLGSIDVKNKPLSDVEILITKKLAADFLQNPQVSLFVSDYRSQQITVMGAVTNPNVYNVRQSRSIFEMLSLAGGMKVDAADKIRVRTKQTDPETGEKVPLDLLLSVNSLLEGAESASNLRLHGGDSILVPEAGVVFVEGAVKKPGSYKMEGSTNVLKAIALAGGVPWEGKETKIQVIREIGGEPISVDVNLNDVRNQKGHDLELKDGDVVVVGFSVTKRAISGFFKTAGQIFGYSLNR